MLAPVSGPRIGVVGDPEARGDAVAALAAAGFRQVSEHDAVPADAVGPEAAGPALWVVTGAEAARLATLLRERPELGEASVLAVTPAADADLAAHAVASGVDDVVRSPLAPSVLGVRVRRLLAAVRDRQLAREALFCETTLLRVQEIMAASGDSPEGLREALLCSVDLMEFERASLIAHSEGSDRGYVIAATDDPTLTKFTVTMAGYPELEEAVRTRAPLLIADAQEHALTARVAPALAQKGIRAMAVIPVVWHKRVLGALLFRRARPGVDHVTPRKLAFARLLAGDLAAQLADGRVMDSLREQTHRISRASYEAERRLRAIGTLKEYFEAAADGVVALDQDGNVLFVNRSAESITGFARAALMGKPLVDLVAKDQRDAVHQVVRSVLSGQNQESFDLALATASGDPVCVSVATSTVLANHDAAILLFRDVTVERALEAELHKTKDFLEKLIDSTVDAIVAADTHGHVILFNQGAERIYGYAAGDVVGKIPVWKLYPDGVANQIMRMLRSPSYGGVGRLEQTRRELLTQSGEIVPVNMTASIVYEDDREVATVGIFSDLRERIHIEQRLLQAQEKLVLSEKQALVAELAGAAAHELNQPLTSILGYVELIERRLTSDAPHARALGVIRSEAERMAEIVKKIGRITRYETKEYVGSTSILDLDKSIEAGQSPDPAATGRRESKPG
jgi:PAS domain S-box-containing protein